METSADARSDRGDQEGGSGDRASSTTSTGMTARLHDCHLSEDFSPSRFADFDLDARSIIEQSRLDRVLAAGVSTPYSEWEYVLLLQTGTTYPRNRQLRRRALVDVLRRKRPSKGLSTWHPIDVATGPSTRTRSDLGSLRCASMTRPTENKRKRCRTYGNSMTHARTSTLDLQTRQIELLVSQKIYELDVKRGISPLNSRHRYVVVDDANVCFPSSTSSSYKDHPPANVLPTEM
jgi:hypothetical protein